MSERDYSILIPASLIAVPILATSAFMRTVNSCGVLPTTSAPVFRYFSFTSGLLSMRTIS